MQMMIAVNDRGYRVGESHPRAALTDAEVELIRRLHEREKMSYPIIAEKFEISVHTAGRICRYQRRAEVATRWKTIEVDG